MSSLNKIRLEDGTELSVAEWLHQPVYSTMEFASTASVDLSAFNYVVGQRVSATTAPAPAGSPRTANERDTNLVRKRAMNQDEALIVFAITYEIFALSTLTGGSPPEEEATLPMTAPTEIRRLQRDCLVELYVGAGIKKPQIQVPFAWIHQSVGSPAWTSGNYAESKYGTGGTISARNQELLKLPVYIGGFGEAARPGDMMTFWLRFWSPPGTVMSLQQDIRLRWHLDGLKKRPA